MKRELKLAGITLCALTLFLVGNVNDADAAAYIKFDGVDGEAKDKDHVNWSDLMSFQMAIHKPGSGATGSTRNTASAVFEDFAIAKELDKSSPKLSESILTGKVFPKVEIQLGSSAGTYLSYELTNVMVTSYSIGGGASQIPMEEFSLNFEEIKVTYTEYGSDGKSKGKVETSWKVEEGTK